MNTAAVTQTWEPPDTGDRMATAPQPVTTPPTKTKRPPHTGRRWRKALLPGAALLVGILVGTGIGIGSQDPTASDQYKTQGAELSIAQQQVTNDQGLIRTERSRANAAVASASSAAAQRQAELDQREAAVKSREDAVGAIEQHIAATSIGEGVWTVGRDVEPGTYTTKDAVTGACYWSITKTGSNGSFSDIVANDFVSGGRPTVTLKQGQDFKNQGCGVFIQQ